MNISDYFNAYVITLSTWPQRLEVFLKRADDLDIHGFKLVQGVDGDKIGKPNWWKPTARKWACNLAHLDALHQGIMLGDKPILILEDDAHLRNNFIESIPHIIEYYETHKDPTVCFLGGRPHNKGDRVSDRIDEGVVVGGGYGYSCSQKYAVEMSAYFMNDPRSSKKAFYAQDTKMMRRSVDHKHAIIRPVCVGHRGGRSILLKRNRRPTNVKG